MVLLASTKTTNRTLRQGKIPKNIGRHKKGPTTRAGPWTYKNCLPVATGLHKQHNYDDGTIHKCYADATPHCFILFGFPLMPLHHDLPDILRVAAQRSRQYSSLSFLQDGHRVHQFKLSSSYRVSCLVLVAPNLPQDSHLSQNFRFHQCVVVRSGTYNHHMIFQFVQAIQIYGPPLINQAQLVIARKTIATRGLCVHIT